MTSESKLFSNLISDCVRRAGLQACGYHCDDDISLPTINDFPLAAPFHLLYKRGQQTLVHNEFVGHKNFDNIQDLTSKHGLQIYYLSLEPVLNRESGTFVIYEVGHSAIRSLKNGSLIRGCQRKLKKQLRAEIETLQPWRHPSTQEDIHLGLANIREFAAQEYQKWENESFYDTLHQYSDFVESFSHESLSPLQEVQNTLAQVRGQLGDEHQKEIQDLSSAERAVDRIRVSLSGMRLLFKGEGKPLENQYRDVDLRELVQAWVNFFHEQIADKNLEAIIEPEGQAWRERVVKEYIEVLIKNLIENAVKYSFQTHRQGQEGKIVVRWDSAKHRISVVSFGVPIPPDEIEDESLFSISRRGSTSNDRGRMGRGVGLHLIKQIADLHDARVEVKSEVMNPDSFNKEHFARNEFSIYFRADRPEHSKRRYGSGKGVVRKHK